MLAQGSLRYRRQILALKHFFAQRKTTVLLLDDLTSDETDKTVHSVAHGVILLEELAPEYGADRRRLRVMKYRGSRFRGGYHDFVIVTGGIQVFPRLVSSEHRYKFKRDTLKTSSKQLNALLGGGVERGSSVLVLGPAGAGKSIIALTFAVSAVKRGERVAMFVFDEELGLLIERAKGLGIHLEAMQKDRQAAPDADRCGRDDARRVFRARPRCHRNVQGEDDRHRQPERLSGGDARGTGADPAHARTAPVLQSERCDDFPDRRPARPARRDEGADRPDLPRRYRDPAALLRDDRRGAARHFGRQEAHERPREHDSRVHAALEGDFPGRSLTNLHGVLRGTPTFVGGDESPERRAGLIPHLSERGLILAPHGRDAEVAASMLAEAKVRSVICSSLAELLDGLKAGAGFALVTEEALHTADLHPLADWIARQPEWSDFPFVLLTLRGGGIERNPRALRYLQALGNAAILERPFHPTSLVSLVKSAIRGRRRQYEARARLEVLAELNATLEARVDAAITEHKVLADIVESTDAFVQVVDPHFRFMAINRASVNEFKRIYGIRPRVGDSLLELLKHMPEQQAIAEAAWSRALTGEKFTEIRKFGDPKRAERYYEMKFNPLHDREGRQIGAYQFVYDVTQRLEDQERLAATGRAPCARPRKWKPSAS